MSPVLRVEYRARLRRRTWGFVFIYLDGGRDDFVGGRVTWKQTQSQSPTGLPSALDGVVSQNTYIHRTVGERLPNYE